MSNLVVLPQHTAICRLGPNEEVPTWVQSDGVMSIVRTPEELSIVCEEQNVPGYIQADKGWRILKVQGPLEFSQVGVLAGIALPLAQAGVSIFAISTYDTDYIFVKDTSLNTAIGALKHSGHIVEVA
jgi:uncharacterized protein